MEILGPFASAQRDVSVVWTSSQAPKPGWCPSPLQLVTLLFIISTTLAWGSMTS